MRKALFLVIAFMLVMPLYPKAQTKEMGREQAFSLLKEAYEAQVSLSEQLRSKEEISQILSPFFTESYAKLFWDANVAEEDGKFVTYGTDFAQYYIPYYQFSDETKVVTERDKTYVFEFFPKSTEGPVGYKAHYEGLLLEKLDGNWKVSKYLYDEIPLSVINKAKVQEPADMNGTGAEETTADDEERTAAIQMQLGTNPLGNLIQYGALLGTGQPVELASMLEPEEETLAFEN